MYSGAKLLTELRQAGFKVELLGDRIAVSPMQHITDQLRDRIRYRRNEALAHLVLETQIRAMATRWGYSDEELTEALTGAAIDPDGWRAWVDHDEQRFGNGASPVLAGRA